MIYLFESELSENKSIIISLTHIYGIGQTNALIFNRKLGFSTNFKTTELSKKQINNVIKIIEASGITLAGDLKKIKLLITKKLLSIKSYRGLRLYRGLPVRGQRTHTNAKTPKKIKTHTNAKTPKKINKRLVKKKR